MNFFEEQKTQSFIKTEITRKYFDAWSRIMVVKNRVQKLAYVDLFAGPGNYDDGNPSTPIYILKHCIENEKLRDKMVFIFNDKEEEIIEELKHNISNIEGMDLLSHYPYFLQSEVDDNFAKTFEKIKMVPTFSFVDPFGYKGVTRKLIFSLIKDFGSDCIMFFNYNRIQAGITNPLIDSHMKNLFSEEIHEKMKTVVPTLDKELKEAYIIEMLSQSLSNNGNNLILPFKFISEEKDQTSHYIIFISKSALGYEIMKDIMAKQSTLIDEGGIASFSYIPVKHLKNRSSIQLNILSEYEIEGIDNLKSRILNNFKNQTITMEKLFEKDNIGTKYTRQNYKEALRQLESEGKVIINPPANVRPVRKGVVTVSDKVKITI